MSLIDNVLLAFIGLAGGLAVGSGFVAFLTVLDIIPRLTVITRTQRYIRSYEHALILGAFCATWMDFRGWTVHLSPMGLIPIGLIEGCFIGLLAAALTEVINVLPILAKRIRLQDHVKFLLMAMVFGKVIGSLFQWVLFTVH
ncbi:stage V sporulation protein AB [Marininema halotolerans]|uniref:Stage V sporulation protein AB n=1 Tax=Marininema halotolerans TaxID=1155944 RepID=A0A1I6TSF2_9BACL|nr:stage V sporulation protein AB [Marininema halotolerans]SFS92203.1 stage V sporulation protein AB [Marininema halotolerans]